MNNLPKNYKLRKDLRNETYSIVAQIDKSSVTYWGYEIMSLNSVLEEILWEHETESGAIEPVDAIEKATPLFTGFVKWDGCCNFIQWNTHCYMHFCSKKDIENYGKALLACYDWTKELLENFEG